MTHAKSSRSSGSAHLSWWAWLRRVFAREMKLVASDLGVLIFFLGLPLLYPLVYTVIYNPETVKDMPVAIVDQSATQASRHLTRMADATDAIHVAHYAPTLSEARRLMDSHEVYGILLIPSDYAKKIGQGEQATAIFYSEMSLLLRYRAFMSALTEVQLALGAEIRAKAMEPLAAAEGMISIPQVGNEGFFMGDPTQGFASFIIPGIVILILQQSMLLGVTMLAAGSSERRRRNGLFDPLAIPAPPSASIMGKMLCYVAIYIPLTLYVIHIVPSIFSLPHVGSCWRELVYLFPMLVASAFMGIALSVFVTERESSLLVIVFTSVFLLFLSGLTWPRYAMSNFWVLVGDCIPAIRGMEGFIRINSNGASLMDESHSYLMTWVLAAIYMALAYILTRYRSSSRRLVTGSLQ
ncbi:MAG: ABC transporter permease [Pseudoflavonifractor sp.]|nr:ABC transporter permease [Alloprevotella sp.]MCM1117223.1 ABC transporter permease [Pseudoflavonifractor sp.]